MAPLIVHLVSYIVIVLMRMFLFPNYKLFKFSLRAESISIGFLFVVAGVAHFMMATPMVEMIPSFVPFRYEMVYVSGVFELLSGFALIYGTPYTRTIGAVLILFLISSLPINIYSAVYNVGLGAKGINYLWFRVPLQLFWMFWIWIFLVRKKY